MKLSPGTLSLFTVQGGKPSTRGNCQAFIFFFQAVLTSPTIALQTSSCCSVTKAFILSLQIFTIEFIAFAIEFVPFAVEFIAFAVEFSTFAVEFIGFAIEFAALAIEFDTFAIEFDTFEIKLGTFALEFVYNDIDSCRKHKNKM